jgi:hypothetical protein
MEKQDFFATLLLKSSLWQWLNSFRIPRWQAEWAEEARKHVAESFSTKKFSQTLNQYLISITGSKED